MQWVGIHSSFCAQEFKWANKRDHESKTHRETHSLHLHTTISIQTLVQRHTSAKYCAFVAWCRPVSVPGHSSQLVNPCFGLQSSNTSRHLPSTLLLSH